MSKYIIKNCPARLVFEDISYCQDFKYIGVNKPCANCSDCLLKQIVEKCKKENCFVARYPIQEYSDAILKNRLAHEILQLFKIQKIEE